MFPDRRWFSWTKTFNGESDSSGINDACSGCGRPHNAHPITKINKVKDLALIFYQCLLFTPSRLHLLSKHLERAFFLCIFYLHPLNEMFIVKVIYCLIAVTTLLLTSGLHRW